MFDYLLGSAHPGRVGRGRPKTPLVLTAQQEDLLALWRKTRVTEPTAHLNHRARKVVAGRARIILLSANGKTNREVAKAVGASVASVSKWRNRFIVGGPEALVVAPRSGKQLSEGDDFERALKVRAARGESTRAIAAALGVSQSSVARRCVRLRSTI